MIPLQLRELTKAFGQRVVVDIEALDMVPGELLALLGPSGCGKSTTLRLIAGLERPDHGTIAIGGATVVDDRLVLPPERRQVGLVFQDYALFPHLTVAGNVAYGLPRAERSSPRIDALLDLVGLTGFGDRYPRELSGGQQQRVALARALAPSPKLLLLDEPFSSLDPGLRQHLRAEVRRILQHAGTTGLLVTHDQEEALSIADRVAVMLEGQIVQIDTPERIYYAPVSPAVALFIGDANLLDGIATAHGIETPLGLLTRPTAQRGPVRVMLRPELIDLSPAPDRGGVEGVVRDIDFFGHDYVAVVDVPGLADPVRVRLVRFVVVQPGHRVWLSVASAGMIYPVT
ncbi:MAG TPA: ABC transporter ATP-binding protein [Thermomicrobiales bacterium]|nr:ABC transporter ATP-binding protein [Thermomicrobiales bacterium]